MRKVLKMIVAVALVALTAVGLASCGGDDGKIKIGVLQYVTHDALDATLDGFKEALNDAGYDSSKVKITVRNPEADASSLASSAKYLVRESDLIFAIATPAALAIKAELENQGKTTPTFFSAVTDPVESGLLLNANAPEGAITGTSDMNPVAEQIALIKQVVTDAKKVGIMYTSNEDNSRIQAEMAATEITDNGMTSVTKTVAEVNQIQQTFNALVSDDVDAIYIPTDNVMASQMSLIGQLAMDAKVAVFCGEESMVAKGGLATIGINYTRLGKQTGVMAVKYLNGEKTIAQLPVESSPLSEMSYIVNTTVADTLDITLPAILADAKKVTLE